MREINVERRNQLEEARRRLKRDFVELDPDQDEQQTPKIAKLYKRLSSLAENIDGKIGR